MPLPAGYFSTTARIKERTPLDTALRAVGRCGPAAACCAAAWPHVPEPPADWWPHHAPAPCSLEALELLERITKNAAVQPAEEKFRKLKLR